MAPSLSEHFLFLRLLLLSLLLPSLTLSQNSSSSSSSPSTSCPLDFSVLAKPLNQSAASNSIPSDTSHRCDFALNCLHLVLAQYLLTTSRFLPPPSAAASCWSALSDQLAPFLPPPFSLLSSCGFQTPAISQGCMNISTLQAFDAAVPAAARAAVNQSCNQPLLPIPACTACSASLNQLAAGYLRGGSPKASGAATCADYAAIYAGAFANRFGLADNGTVFCLFLLGSNSTFPPPASTAGANGGGGGGPAAWVYGVVAAAAGGSLLLLLAALAVWLRKRRHRRRRRRSVGSGSRPNAAMESLNASTNLIKFTFEEIKAATKGFSRENLIGRGGYGNVYRGTLPGGDEVAVKRFKNCSAAGDASFVHEVEVIASVRHVNLVDLRGYCSATTQMEGYQRMIVCDLMRKGSLHDHLFGSSPVEEEEEGGRRRRRLSWPLRQRIAVGTARGLAYLHDGARPGIIHRDIKASNILLDERFEPKVADFGLARFAPEGASHVSTRVAGTLGYVAPEYALYGQLTEKSDVYSFGVVLLELLSGRKALVSMGEGQAFLVTDWAWSLVRKGRALAVIEEGMEEPGPEHVMEKYVHVAVLCTHPQLHARPTMDQIVKILETDMAVPSIPDRPIPIVSSMEDISRSVSSSGSEESTVILLHAAVTGRVMLQGWMA